MAEELWERVESLVARAPSTSALRAHRLHLLAAAFWQAEGRAVPAELRQDRRRAAILAVTVVPLLERIRSVCDGPLVLMKGPEVACRYSQPEARPFRDLDLLVEDAPAAQRALTAAGFVELGDAHEYEQAQHLSPLVWPGLPLVVEIHRRPNQPGWLPAAPVHDIVATAVASATGVSGVLAPVPEAHALLLAAHAWAEAPLGRLLEPIDIAAIIDGGDWAKVEQIAADWGWTGLGRISRVVVEALFGPDPRPPLPLWAGHLEHARERLVVENQIARIAAPLSTLPPRQAAAAVAGSLVGTLGRREGETLAGAIRRARLSLFHAFMDKSDHERSVGWS